MSDSAFASRLGRVTSDDRTDVEQRVDAEAYEDLGSFGWLRGVRERSVMLELRKRDGRTLAIGYGWVERVEFNPSAGITLQVAGQRVRVSGRNLNAVARGSARLFEGICQHRVPWIQEASRATSLDAPDEACIVEAIDW